MMPDLSIEQASPELGLRLDAQGGNLAVSDAITEMILLERKIAYALADRDLRVVEVKDPAIMLGCDPDACLGRSLTEVVPELEGNEAPLVQVLAGELPRFQLAWVNRVLPDGETAYLTLVHLPHRDASGQIVGLILLVDDVTEAGTLGQQLTQERNELRLAKEILAEQYRQLATANSELQRLDEVKSAFVSIAAHELRTPLTSVLGYLELLLGGDAGVLTGQQIEYLRIMELSAQRLLRITNDLLDVTRIEAGHMDLVLRPTDLVALVRSVVAECAPQLEVKTQRLELHAPAQLPQALCDAGRTAQIVSNLLSNASKYSPPRSAIALSLAQTADAGFLLISVADQGNGITSQDQIGIFRPFFRASHATSSGINGAGLGLYIARSLVELHGGRIWYDSTPGQGTTFFVTLPVADRLVASAS
jgi:signal transduction histidine kinase